MEEGDYLGSRLRLVKPLYLRLSERFLIAADFGLVREMHCKIDRYLDTRDGEVAVQSRILVPASSPTLTCSPMHVWNLRLWCSTSCHITLKFYHTSTFLGHMTEYVCMYSFIDSLHTQKKYV